MIADFKIGNIVETPSGKGEVWKVTEESVHVRFKNVGQYGRNSRDYFYAKYLLNPWHHSQTGIDKIKVMKSQNSLLK